MSDVARRAWIAAIVVQLALVLALPQPPAHAADSLAASIEYAVSPMAYDNAVRIADPNMMDFPRIVMDRYAGSPHFGTVYVVGTHRFDMSRWCIQFVVSRSTDGGATFSTPQPSPFCLSSEAGLQDLAVGYDGALTGVVGGAVFRSSDQGGSWTPVAAWDPTIRVLGVSVNPADGVLYAVGSPPSLANRAATLQVSSTPDGGASWSAPAFLPVTSLYFEDATIAAQSSSIAVATLVHRNATGLNTVSVAVLDSQDHAATWSSPTVLSTGTRYPLTPQVRASPEGVFGVSWENITEVPLTNGSTTVRAGISVSRSFDWGQTFSAPERVSDNASWAIGPHGVPITFDDASRMYVTWESTVDDGANTTSFLYAAISAPGLQGGPFAVGLQNFGVSVTEMEDITMGLNDTAYLAWYDVNFDANFTVDNATSGVYVRTVTGLGVGNLTDPSHLLSGTPGLELRSSDGHVAARVEWTGTPIVLPRLVPDAYNVSLTTTGGTITAGTLPVRIWGETRFNVSVTSAPAYVPPKEPGGGVPWPVLAGAGLGVLAAGAAALHYTRLNRENVFQRKVRLLLYEYIREHPGATLTQIRSTFGLHNGVAAYHLGVLETQGFLHSEARRGHRWYYPNGDVSLWKELPLSPLQSAILRSVLAQPGIGVRELSRGLDRRVSSVADNVKALEREGVLRTQRSGRRLHCFPADAAEPT